MEDFMSNHKLHAPVIGGVTYLLIKDKTPNAPVIALGITAVSYWYMSHFGHHLATMKELDNAIGMK